MHKIKSPIIYMGGKYDILEYIDAVVPKNVCNFYDVFAGAFNVGGNIHAEKIVYNDRQQRLAEFFRLLYETEPKILSDMIESRIKECGIIRYKHDTYYKFRDMYNQKQNPIDMFILHCYSYMHMLQWNKDGKMNCACGDAEYNEYIRANLIGFGMKIRKRNIEFMSADFSDVFRIANESETIGNDVVYCDPPYLISNGAYNKSTTQWTENDEKRLYDEIDRYVSNGGLFILSNVAKHREQENSIVKEFGNRYTVYHIENKTYRNLDNLMKTTISTYDSETDEIIVTNIKSLSNPRIFMKGEARTFW